MVSPKSSKENDIGVGAAGDSSHTSRKHFSGAARDGGDGSYRRYQGHVLREEDEAGGSHAMMSQRSDSVKEIHHTPFDMEIDMSEEEIEGLKDAFNRYMDPKDKQISFNELFHDLKAIGIRTKNTLLYEILERILYCDEISGEGNDRMDFETFMRLIKKSLNMRQTKEQVETIFGLFDENGTGYIQIQNLNKVNQDMDMGMGMEDIRRILLCCSSRGDKISFNEFYLIMTREDRNDFSGVPVNDSQPSKSQLSNVGKQSQQPAKVTLEDGQMLNIPLQEDI